MRLKSFEQVIRYIFSMSFMLVYSAPDLDGGGVWGPGVVGGPMCGYKMFR